MIEIPLKRFRDALYLDARINGSNPIEFILDTGCSSICLSKEASELLFLSGCLSEKDINGDTLSSYAGHFTTREKTVVIRQLSIGKLKLKNLTAHICSQYDGPLLLGITFLDALKDYSIKNEKIIINNGKEEIRIEECKGLSPKWQHAKNNTVKFLKTFAGKSKEEMPLFDYHEHIVGFDTIVRGCTTYLCDKKYKAAISILEAYGNLCHRNIDDDLKHPGQEGSYLTGLYFYYLGMSYYQTERWQEAQDFLEKARLFFNSGTNIFTDIDRTSEDLKKRIPQLNVVEEELVPLRPETIEDDIAALHLFQISVVDHIFSDGDNTMAYFGFPDFRTAFLFSVHHRKRLEVVKRENGQWIRTNELPSDDLAFEDLNTDDLEERFYCFGSSYGVSNKAKELISSLGVDEESKRAEIEKNSQIAIDLFDKLPLIHRFYHRIILNKEDLSYVATISPGAHLVWEDTELAICAFDVEPAIAQRLADSVLEGKLIPCAIGQMPEDFTFLSDKCSSLSYFEQDEYKGNNNPDIGKWVKDPFLIMNLDGEIGYAYRETYDNVHWRWQEGHFSAGHVMDSGEDINENNDYLFAYWQLIRVPPEIKGNRYSSEPISSVPFPIVKD